MGQLLRVVSHVRLSETVLRLEVDRSLTGMGLETYGSKSEALGDSTSAQLARNLFDCEHVLSVSIFSNIVTVVFSSQTEAFPDDVRAAVEDLFTHYLPGVEPTPI